MKVGVRAERLGVKCSCAGRQNDKEETEKEKKGKNRREDWTANNYKRENRINFTVTRMKEI